MIKRLLAALVGLLPFMANAAPEKLGSEGDFIRQALFASQPMKVLLAHTKLDGKPGPFETISRASTLVGAGRKEEAASLLRTNLEGNEVETRVTLWTWSCLREIGISPDPKIAGEVIGVVLEMPSGDAYDSLAAYADGSARYLNYSGSGIFWDLKDPDIRRLCGAFIDSTIPSGSLARPRSSVSLPSSGSQVTLLTPSGIYVITNPSGPIIRAGYDLMMALINRSKKNG